MSRIFSRGREIPPEYRYPGVSGEQAYREAKLKAWAILAGAYRPSDEPASRRRIHRGRLDDLPQPQPLVRAPRPSWRAAVAAIGRALGLGGRPAAEQASLAGAAKAPVGESLAVTYIEPSGARESGSHGSKDTASRSELACAA